MSAIKGMYKNERIVHRSQTFACNSRSCFKQSKAIETYPVLRGIIHAVLENPDIHLALLFGSYAKGTAHDKSDIDLFVETRDPNVKNDLEKRHRTLSVKTGAFDRENLLIREIIKDHIIVRGMEDYYEKIRFLE